MGYDEKTAERVRRILTRRKSSLPGLRKAKARSGQTRRAWDVVERKMIGGVSFMVNGRMCCGLTSAGLMVRVGAQARERTLAQPHARRMKFAGRSLAGFVCVDPEGYRTDAALAKWVQRGIDFVSKQPAKTGTAGKLRSKTPQK